MVHDHLPLFFTIEPCLFATCDPRHKHAVSFKPLKKQRFGGDARLLAIAECPSFNRLMPALNAGMFKRSAKFRPPRARHMPIATSYALSGLTYKLGADVLNLPPNNSVGAVPSSAVAMKEQHEFVDRLDTIKLKPDALGRDCSPRHNAARCRPRA